MSASTEIGKPVVLDRARVALAAAETLEEVTEIRGRAEAVRGWAKSAREHFELQNTAAELKLRAERKAGRLLANLCLRGGDRKSNGHRDRLKLSDLGITQSQSKRWQHAAGIPSEVFERYFRSANASGEEITTAGLIRAARPAKTARARGRRRYGGSSRVFSGVAASSFPGQSGTHRTEPRDLPCPGGSTAETEDLVAELCRHHETLTGILEPLCSGRQQTLLPGQRRGIRRYLSEIGAGLRHLTR